METASIQISKLVKVYSRRGNEVRALKGIDLEVHRGEIFGLLGPNGAGKTTTVGVCTTRVRATSGRVVVDGIDVAADPAAVKRSIGVVTQFRTLDRALTTRENLAMHSMYFGLQAKDAWARADELLEDFRLSERAGALPDELSGGMAQRVQVARAIAHQPSVLFLDEPTAGLDPQSRLALWEMIGSMHRRGITVFLTTHYMEEAESLCDRVAIIDHGEILVLDTPDALKRSIHAETVIELRLEKQDEQLLERLRGLSGVVSAEPSSDGIRVLTASEDGVLPQILAEAHAFGLRDLRLAHPTLETVFISLTGRELRE
ncbi:MAG: ABC transporter ATP-binding protein [Actinomycetota bacterium]